MSKFKKLIVGVMAVLLAALVVAPSVAYAYDVTITLNSADKGTHT